MLIAPFDDVGAKMKAGEEAAALRDRIGAAAEFVGAINNSIGSITDGVSEIALATKKLAQSSCEISQHSGNTLDAVRSASSKAADAIAGVERLAGIAERVAEIVRTIAAIAAQNRILGLNAAIEASRSKDGEAFGVVADEIKNMASTTADAAKMAANLLNDVRNEVDHAVESVHQMAQQIRRVESANEEIDRTVLQHSSASAQVATAIKEIETELQNMRGAITVVDNGVQNNVVRSSLLARALEYSSIEIPHEH